MDGSLSQGTATQAQTALDGNVVHTNTLHM